MPSSAAGPVPSQQILRCFFVSPVGEDRRTSVSTQIGGACAAKGCRHEPCDGQATPSVTRRSLAPEAPDGRGGNSGRRRDASGNALPFRMGPEHPRPRAARCGYSPKPVQKKHTAHRTPQCGCTAPLQDKEPLVPMADCAQEQDETK